jgi:hypothetical protein
MTGDIILQRFIEIFGYAPPDGDPLAELRRIYAELVRKHERYGINDALVLAVSEVTGLPITLWGNPLAFFLLNGSAGAGPVQTLVDDDGNLVFEYDDEKVLITASVGGDDCLIRYDDAQLGNFLVTPDGQLQYDYLQAWG